ncbi:STAS domain-containing protein [Nakamurella endophytica]|uniref:Anti-sigma factor antagonist n=1 Tax=Nakamurella endophytica TaxID=1748367 RepID=A0A917T420_9ACTN|nr:STAS domain-containing protein [Nakamurella endophytica]GGM08990.1 anti-sigma factor antagonist [Nakamurella endophytica]
MTGVATDTGAAAGGEGTDLRIEITADEPGAAVLRLAGRLDALQAPELDARFRELVPLGRVRLLVDLSAVGFVDSAGLAVLVRARRTTREHGGDVVLIRPRSPEGQRVFRLTQFDQVFRMLDESPR